MILSQLPISVPKNLKDQKLFFPNVEYSKFHYKFFEREHTIGLLNITELNEEKLELLKTTSLKVKTLMLSIDCNTYIRDAIQFSKSIRGSLQKIIVKICVRLTGKNDMIVEEANKWTHFYSVEIKFSPSCEFDEYLLLHLSPDIVLNREVGPGITIKNAQIFYKYDGKYYKIEAEMVRGTYAFSKKKEDRKIKLGLSDRSTGFLISIGKRKISRVKGKIPFKDPESEEMIDIRSLIDKHYDSLLYPVNSDLVIDYN